MGCWSIIGAVVGGIIGSFMGNPMLGMVIGQMVGGIVGTFLAPTIGMNLPDLRRDREQMVSASTTPRKIIYGTCRVSGQLVYLETTGGNNEYCHIIVAVAGHPVQGFGDVFLDDKPISEYGTNAYYETYDGSQTAACASMVTVSASNSSEAVKCYATGNTEAGVARISAMNSVIGLFAGMTVSGDGMAPEATITFVGDNYIDLSIGATGTYSGSTYTLVGTRARWTSDHKLLGISYIYLKLTYSEKLFPAGLPTLTVVVFGKKVYDPRNGRTQYSSNPALCVRDYMLTSPALGGMGCDPSEISESHIITAAAICDQSVDKNLSGTIQEKRYMTNGTITVDGTPKQAVEGLLQSMAGAAIYAEGQWKIYAGAYTQPVATLDESWLAGGISFGSKTGKNERINTIKGKFIDPSDSWAMKAFPVLTSEAYIDEDGGEELAYEVNLNFTTSPTMAQRIGKIMLEKSRLSGYITYPCNFKAFHLEPNDVVMVNNSRLGWSNRIFRVMSWSFNTTGGVNLSLREDDPAVYSWTPENIIEITLPPPVILPNPDKVAAPTIINSGTGGDNGISYSYQIFNEKYIPVVNISWASSATASASEVIDHYVVMIDGVLYGTTTTPYLNNIQLPPGEHEIKIAAVNKYDVQSSWAVIVSDIPPYTVPPNPPVSVVAAVGVGVVNIFITKPADLNLASFVIRYGASWETGSQIGVLSAKSDTYTWICNVFGTVQFFVKSLDTSGNYSTTATASNVVTITPSYTVNLLDSSGQNLLDYDGNILAEAA